MTYNEKGDILHPDHIMANRMTLRAFQASADPQFEIDEVLEPWQPTKLYYTAIPLARIRKMYKIAKERGEEPGFDPDVIGTPEEQNIKRGGCQGIPLPGSGGAQLPPEPDESKQCHKAYVRGI